MDTTLRKIRSINGKRVKKRQYDDQQESLIYLSDAEVRRRLKTMLRSDPVAMERYKRYLDDQSVEERTYGSDFRGFEKGERRGGL